MIPRIRALVGHIFLLLSIYYFNKQKLNKNIQLIYNYVFTSVNNSMTIYFSFFTSSYSNLLKSSMIPIICCGILTSISFL